MRAADLHIGAPAVQRTYIFRAEKSLIERVKLLMSEAEKHLCSRPTYLRATVLHIFSDLPTE